MTVFLSVYDIFCKFSTEIAIAIYYFSMYNGEELAILINTKEEEWLWLSHR